jgi:hypothetical protein
MAQPANTLNGAIHMAIAPRSRVLPEPGNATAALRFLAAQRIAMAWCFFAACGR